MSEIIVLASIESIRIYINGLLHLHFLKDEYVGLQSWTRVDKSYVSKFCIEITCKTNKITVEYEDGKLWEEVLKKLEEKL